MLEIGVVGFDAKGNIDLDHLTDVVSFLLMQQVRFYHGVLKMEQAGLASAIRVLLLA